MRVVAVAVFLLSGIPLAAQSSPQMAKASLQGPTVLCDEKAQPDGSTVTVCTTAPVQGCPVDMRVRQRMGGGMTAVDENGVRRRVFAQRLRLFLNDLRPDFAGQQIVSARVTVHGSNGKERIQRVGSGSIDDRDMSSGQMARTLNVDLANWGEPGVSGDFRLPEFTSASRVDLVSVTYEDGSTWKLSGNETCRVAPDPLMLIHQ